jgi:hypothetical protein
MVPVAEVRAVLATATASDLAPVTKAVRASVPAWGPVSALG